MDGCFFLAYNICILRVSFQITYEDLKLKYIFYAYLQFSTVFFDFAKLVVFALLIGKVESGFTVFCNFVF